MKNLKATIATLAALVLVSVLWWVGYWIAVATNPMVWGRPFYDTPGLAMGATLYCAMFVCIVVGVAYLWRAIRSKIK